MRIMTFMTQDQNNIIVLFVREKARRRDLKGSCGYGEKKASKSD